jgi:hypothetical protein
VDKAGLLHWWPVPHAGFIVESHDKKQNSSLLCTASNLHIHQTETDSYPLQQSASVETHLGFGFRLMPNSLGCLSVTYQTFVLG